MNYSHKQLNSQSHLYIQTGNLRATPYDVEEILDVKIHQRINEHSTLYFKSVLKAASVGSISDVPGVGGNVALTAIEASGEEYVLFQGLVIDAIILPSEENPIIEVHAISHSYTMDLEKKSRSFQNKNKTYTDLMEQVTLAYQNGDVIDKASNNKTIGKLIVQHMETDWEFLVRMASHFYTGLVNDVRFDSPKFFFGIPEGASFEPDKEQHSLKKDLNKYYNLSKNCPEQLSEADFLFYEVETYHMATIGDNVTLMGKQLRISEITTITIEGLLVNFLSLTTKGGLTQHYRQHESIVGASFGGNILEVSNDLVKISLDIDNGHDSGEPCFFPYSTIYSSQDGSGWYCMPEIGDRVRLYFPDGEDNDAYAISSVHEKVDPALMHPEENQGGAGGGMRSAEGSGGYSGLRDDPNVKSLTFGSQEVRLTPEGMYLFTEDSMILLTEDGIEINSEKDVDLTTEGNFVMDSEAAISISGEQGVKVRSGEANAMFVNEDVQSIGMEVKAN